MRLAAATAGSAVGTGAGTALLIATLAASTGLQARTLQAAAAAAGELPAVQMAALPAQAQATQRLILAGGPFPHAKDGSAFGNREHLLPRKPRGWYREYTVTTRGARDRGSRRIVCGGEPPARPEVCYYTDDHYASFRRIAQ